MKLKIQLVSVIDGHEQIQAVADLERETLEPEILEGARGVANHGVS